MSKFELLIGNEINHEMLKEYTKSLELAYINGKARGGSMDWNDVQVALDYAIKALGPEAVRFMESAEAGNLGDDCRVVFAEGVDVSSDTWSAVKLLIAYRNPEYVDWSEIDSAREAIYSDCDFTPGM